MAKPISRQDITGLILAGGQGLRMGGVDKGLQSLHEQPLVQHGLNRLAPQVGSLLINANRNLDHYARWGWPVVPDTLAKPIGPLGGLLAGLSHCSNRYLVTVPCDSPHFPLDLVVRLAQALVDTESDLAVAAAHELDAQGQPRLRMQPVFCLVDRQLLPGLARYIEDGGRKFGAWIAQQKHVVVPFTQATDDPQAFVNLNTLQDLAHQGA